jgi:hypothetical protein
MFSVPKPEPPSFQARKAPSHLSLIQFSLGEVAPMNQHKSLLSECQDTLKAPSSSLRRLRTGVTVTMPPNLNAPRG